MSDQMNPTTPEAITAIRKRLIGENKVTIDQAAVVFDVTTRSIYSAITRHSIPFTKIFGTRYLELDDLRRAVFEDGNTAPRRSGRPRKHSSN